MIIKIENMVKIDSAEDAPVGVDLLVYNGCDFEIDHIDICTESGDVFWSNYSCATHYAELELVE